MNLSTSSRTSVLTKYPRSPLKPPTDEKNQIINDRSPVKTRRETSPLAKIELEKEPMYSLIEK